MIWYEINRLIIKSMRYDCWWYTIWPVWDMMGHPNTHYCQDEITAGCAHMIVKETLRNFVSGHYQAECTKPCVQPQYKLSQFALNMWPRKVQNTSRYIMTSNSIWIFKRHLLSFQTLSVLEDNKCWSWRGIPSLRSQCIFGFDWGIFWTVSRLFLLSGGFIWPQVCYAKETKSQSCKIRTVISILGYICW